jgi:hypothetical protein
MIPLQQRASLIGFLSVVLADTDPGTGIADSPRSSFAKQLGVSPQTIKRWETMLQETGILAIKPVTSRQRALEIFPPKERIRLSQSPIEGHVCTPSETGPMSDAPMVVTGDPLNSNEGHGRPSEGVMGDPPLKKKSALQAGASPSVQSNDLFTELLLPAGVAANFRTEMAAKLAEGIRSKGFEAVRGWLGNVVAKAKDESKSDLGPGPMIRTIVLGEEPVHKATQTPKALQAARYREFSRTQREAVERLPGDKACKDCRGCGWYMVEAGVEPPEDLVVLRKNFSGGYQVECPCVNAKGETAIA